jgi:hypothetical protein
MTPEKMSVHDEVGAGRQRLTAQPVAVSQNNLSIDHLRLACRHVDEMVAAGVTENLAIRTLELFSDVYAKLLQGGSATPHHVTQVPLEQWSDAARQLLNEKPEAKPKDHFRVEHGTPRRAFARMVRQLNLDGSLTDTTMADLVGRLWKLAVITIEEDVRLNKIARSRPFSSPDERWRAAGISFGGFAHGRGTNLSTSDLI